MRRARRLPVEALRPCLLDIESLPAGSVSWHDVFGNDHPVEVEVGFGKGMFLLTAAQERPERNFLGLEIERAFQLYAANRVAKRGLANVRLACGDARDFFRARVPNQSLLAIHVYFPDPWWKTRHRKRRLFTEDFAANCARTLRPGGKLHIASDVADYFTTIEKLMTGLPGLRPLPAAAVDKPRHDLDYLTNFERKYRKEDRPIFRLLLERVV